MNIKSFIVLIAMWMPVCLSAHSPNDAMLFGDVKSTADGRHLPYINIVVKGTRFGTSTDASGHFKLANLPLGKQVIVIQGIGYKQAEREVFMEAGKSVQLFVDLEPDALNLEQVVITGTRTPYFIKNVPVRTEVLTARAIENKNAHTLYDALEGIAGLRVENQCQSCNFTMVRMQGLGAEHTQILVDGMPIYSGLAGVYGLQQMSTLDIDRVEVVKGAGSALYGSSAVAGAINLVSKEPALAPSTTAEVAMGSYKMGKYSLNSSLRNEKGNLGLSIYAQRYNEGVIDETGPGLTRDEVSAKDGVSDRVETRLDNAGFGLFASNTLMDGDKLVLKGRLTDEFRRGGILTDDVYKNPYTEGTENILTQRYETSLSYRFRPHEQSEASFSFAWANHNREATNDTYLSDYMTAHNGQSPDVSTFRPYTAHENLFTSAFTYGIKTGKHSFLAGVQYNGNRLEESGMYVVLDTLSPSYGSPYRSLANKSADEWGFFVQDEWQIGRRLTAVPGVRADHHRSGETYSADIVVNPGSSLPGTSLNQWSVNPRLALKYDLTESLKLRAGVGTGFRAPYGFSEDLHLCSGSPRVWKSSALEPETSLSMNLSLDFYGEHTTMSANVFRTRLKDKIGFSNASPEIRSLGYDYQWENIDDAFVQGLEFSVTTRPAKALELGLDVTFNQGEYDNERSDWTGTAYAGISRKISRFPAQTGYLRLEYSPGRWVFSMNANYQGKMYIDYINEPEDGAEDLSRIRETSPYVLMNARVSFRAGMFRLFAGVNNIAGYIQDERHLDDAAFLYAPVYGRLFSGGISFTISH